MEAKYTYADIPPGWQNGQLVDVFELLEDGTSRCIGNYEVVDFLGFLKAISVPRVGLIKGDSVFIASVKETTELNGIQMKRG